MRRIGRIGCGEPRNDNGRCLVIRETGVTMLLGEQNTKLALTWLTLIYIVFSAGRQRLLWVQAV
ncbi:MAG: hypothetical protein JWR21_3737 [Herminiimonas sp.]|nr:hypothetical protein [Herminiimonas sp.]